MKKKYLLIFILFIAVYNYAQNIGINQSSPTNSLHVSPVNLGLDPLRIDGVQAFTIGDSSLLVISSVTGIVRYINPSDFISLISGGNGLGTDNQQIDSLTLNGLILNTYIEDGGFSSVDLTPVMDSAISYLINNSDTIDTDVDSVVLSGNILTIYEDGNSVFVNLSSFSDGDNDPNNEIELPSTATTGQVLSWNGTAWVAQNASSGADNWGTQVINISGSNIQGN